MIVQSHSEGEVSGLCTIEDKGKFVTAGDDGKILMFDTSTKKCTMKGNAVSGGLNSKAPEGRGAASLSSNKSDQQKISVAY